MLDRVSEIPFWSNLQAAAFQTTSLQLSSKQFANIAACRQVTAHFKAGSLFTAQIICNLHFCSSQCQDLIHSLQILCKGNNLQRQTITSKCRTGDWLVMGEQGRGFGACVCKRVGGGKRGSKEKQLYEISLLLDNVIFLVTCNDV